MKSRHLLALATGACLGLAGLGQTAFADRGGEGGDEERTRGCSADMENDSENTIGDSDQDGGLLGLIGLGAVGLNGTSIGLLDNLLCGSSLLNNLDLAILGSTDGDDGRGGDSESEVDCSADHENSSENEIGDSEQEGGLLSLVQLGSVGSNGLSLSALNNLLCGADVLNNADIAILGSTGRDDDRGGDRESEVNCSADHDNSSDNEIGNADQSLGLLNLIGLNSLGLNGTSAGLLGNVGCGSVIGNNLDVAILSGLGLF